MATALGIANRALRILGVPSIAAFSSSGRGPRQLSDSFVAVWNEVLAEDDWYFLVKRAVLADHAAAWTSDVSYAAGEGARHNDVIYNCLLAASDIEPGVHASSSSYWETQTQEAYAKYTNYWYRYDLPTDVGRPLALMPAGYQYISEEDWLYTDYTPDTTNLYPRLVYLADVLTSSSAGPAIASAYQSRIPDWFAGAVAAKLAMETAPELKGNDNDLLRAQRAYALALRRAQENNARNNPGPDVEQPLWADTPRPSASWNRQSTEPGP